MKTNDIIHVNPRCLLMRNGEEVFGTLFHFFLEVAYCWGDYFKTEWYRNYLSEIYNKNYGAIYGIRNIEELNERVEYLFNLNEAIKIDPEFKNIDKVEVFIDQNGRIRIFEGNHRSICCIYNDIKSIPVIVKYRHPKWEKIKMETIINRNGKYFLYNKIKHPDLNKYKTIRKPFEKEIINAFNNNNIIPVESKNIDGYLSIHKYNNFHFTDNFYSHRLTGIDIGSHFGYYTRLLESLGADVIGIEKNKKFFDICQKITKAEGMSTIFKNENAFNFVDKLEQPVDFFLLLSVFIYLKNESEKKLKKMLNKVSQKSNILIIDTHGFLKRSKLLKYVYNNTEYNKHFLIGKRDYDYVYKFIKE
jgi:hypothetical protein